MTNYKIKKLADFFYSSESSNDVPLRIMITTGQYSGFNITKDGFITLMSILNNSKNLHKDLIEFINKYGI
jgi:hypothetical protein